MKTKMNCTLNMDVEIKNDYHFGNIVLDSLKRHNKDFIYQIDAATGERQTYGTALDLVVRLARSLRNLGTKPGDIILLGGINHLRLRIPFYAGLTLGLPVCGMDPAFKTYEIKTILEKTKAKVAFCDYANYNYYKKAAEQLGSDITIVILDTGDFDDFINKYDDGEPIEDFSPSVFDVEKVYAILMVTSGTTGSSKLVAVKHATLLQAFKRVDKYSDEWQKIYLSLGAFQWITSYLVTIQTLLTGDTLIISSKYNNVDDLIDIITIYRPMVYVGAPTVFHIMIKQEKECDLTCFNTLMFGGAKIPKEVVLGLKARMRKDALLLEVYGQTEMMVLALVPDKDTPIGSCGRANPFTGVKLVDQNTNEEITEPNVPGHLLYKGPKFSGYYGDPEETAKALTEDGWLKTGDVMYRDENGYFFYVERIKMFMKYRNFQIAPTQIEDVISKLPSVLEVCVTGIVHPTDDHWPVAVVVKRPGYHVTAQEIKDLVEEQLSDAKKLRGGVIFLDKLPKTSSGKIARAQVKALAATADRE